MQIPDIVKDLLQLGENFCLPVSNKKSLVINFIKNIEYNINKFSPNFHSVLRDKSIPIRKLFSIQTEPTNNRFIKAGRETKNFLRDNPNVIFTKADKGHITVALDRDSYLNEMQILLSDTNTYSVYILSKKIP